MKKTVCFLLTVVILWLFTACSDDAGDNDKETADVSGKWTGSIDVPGQSLDIIVQFQKKEEWAGTISIPVQGISDYPFSSVTVNGQDVSFLWKSRDSS